MAEMASRMPMLSVQQEEAPTVRHVKKTSSINAKGEMEFSSEAFQKPKPGEVVVEEDPFADPKVPPPLTPFQTPKLSSATLILAAQLKNTFPRTQEKKYPYDELKAPAPFPEDVDPRRREEYLDDGDFEQVQLALRS